MARIHSVVASIRKRLYDNFTRTNTTGGLGTATDGSTWTAVSGTFTVNSNLATGASTSYPIAAQNLPFKNASVSLKSVSQGSGAAIWVTDSGNWWAVGTDTGPGYSCNCGTCSAYSNCLYTNPYTCSGGNTYYYYSYQSSNSGCPQ
jgi:hypothetical protein